MTQGWASGWWTCRGFHGAHHIFVYHQIFVCFTNAIDSCENVLGIVAGDIGNLFFTTPCAENIWSCCGAESGPICGAVVVLKRSLYGLKMASKSFHKYFGDFLRDLGFIPSRVDKDLWICKYDEYEEYDYIATHVDDVIISAKNPSKYMHEIEMHFKVVGIIDGHYPFSITLVFW